MINRSRATALVLSRIACALWRHGGKSTARTDSMMENIIAVLSAFGKPGIAPLS